MKVEACHNSSELKFNVVNDQLMEGNFSFLDCHLLIFESLSCQRPSLWLNIEFWEMEIKENLIENVKVKKYEIKIKQKESDVSITFMYEFHVD